MSGNRRRSTTRQRCFAGLPLPLLGAPGVERGFEWCPHWDHHALFALTLLHANLTAVVLHPGQPNQISLPLSGPQGEQQRELQFVGGHSAEFLDVVRGPNDLCLIGLIEAPAALAHVDGDCPRSLATERTRASTVHA